MCVVKGVIYEFGGKEGARRDECACVGKRCGMYCIVTGMRLRKR